MVPSSTVVQTVGEASDNVQTTQPPLAEDVRISLDALESEDERDLEHAIGAEDGEESSSGARRPSPHSMLTSSLRAHTTRLVWSPLLLSSVCRAVIESLSVV